VKVSFYFLLFPIFNHLCISSWAAEAAKNVSILGIIIVLLIIIHVNYGFAQPLTVNPRLSVERIFTGNFNPSTMAFLGRDDILVLDRDEGIVYRLNHKMEPKVILDVKVGTIGYRGLLGIAISHKDNLPQNVFLYYTEARYHDGDDATNNVTTLGNRVYRYDLINEKLVNPKLILQLPAEPGPRHMGGIIDIGPDNNVYVTVGDIDGTFIKNYETITQNYQNGSYPDGRSGILRVTQDGKPVGVGILGKSFPLNLYYAYGIRNSFGIDWDPITGKLWDTENGPNYGDEINIVEPGFNSGWVSVQGIWKPNFDERGQLSLNPEDLVDFDGRGKYSPPKFIWVPPVAPTAIKFLDSDKFGSEYINDIFVGDANTGRIYDFDLDEKRTGLDVKGQLKDIIADDFEELSNVAFANGFGRITDIDIGPDGFLYILSTKKHMTNIYRISPR